MKRGVEIVLWIVACAVLAGCGRGTGQLDAEDRTLPQVKRAEAKCLQGDYAAAVELYEEALLDHPRAARIHLDLALVLHDHTHDLIGAIYHYRRYMSLRPASEKSRMIDDRIRLAMQQIGAKRGGDEERSLDQIAALEKENTALRLTAEKLDAELKKTKHELATRQTDSPSTIDATASGSRPTPPAVKPKTYRVKRGDTLGSIAREVYGDTEKWRDIYEANKAQIADYDRVPAGLVLKIP